MILAMLALLTLAILEAFRAWRRIEQRNLRWKFYALRDDLRRLAIDDPRVRNSELFLTLDRNLTLFARELEGFSLWKLVPLVFELRREDVRAEVRQFSGELELSQPDNKPMAQIYSRTAYVLMGHVMWTHLGVAALLCATGIGLIVLIAIPLFIYRASDEIRIWTVSAFGALFRQSRHTSRSGIAALSRVA